MEKAKRGWPARPSTRVTLAAWSARRQRRAGFSRWKDAADYEKSDYVPPTAGPFPSAQTPIDRPDAKK